MADLWEISEEIAQINWRFEHFKHFLMGSQIRIYRAENSVLMILND